MSQNPPPIRSIDQLVDKDGNPSKAVATENIWVGGNVFSNETRGNKVARFTTGQKYFKDFIAECNNAQKEIYIAGWQVAWDAQLAEGVRLYDVIKNAAKRNVKIYVMPWEHTLPVQTYDLQTKIVLESINDELKTNNVKVLTAPSNADQDASFFSHHQKQVVIDRKIAYVGGMDLTYGRYDDEKFDLQANKEGRSVMNRYNGCVPNCEEYKEDDPRLVNPDLMSGALDKYAKVPFFGKSDSEKEHQKLLQGGWQVKYQDPVLASISYNARKTAADTPDPGSLDPKSQPRMPWQDIHCRIEGPAVANLLCNFVMRWNVLAKSNERLPLPEPITDTPGTCHIQVLRSAPSGLRKLELEKNKSLVPKASCLMLKPLNDMAEAKGKLEKQNDINRAMVQLIEKSRRFIYIENQFFVSDFGKVQDVPSDESGPMIQINKTFGDALSWGPKTRATIAHIANAHEKVTDSLPCNDICKALGDRIDRAIHDARRPHFHVYITLPVHPEGTLSDATVVTQVHWTMQTLVFGSHSLLNRIRRSLAARELKKGGKANYKNAYEDNGEHAEAYKSIDINECFEYVTLLNLRNFSVLNKGTKDERYITEQIYVHSKLMIVDDCYAIIGSANVNDRSQLGTRDSELAVLICDTDTAREDTAGAGSHQLVRNFAHELRKEVWEKLFGISGGIRSADQLTQAVKQPGSPSSWRAIQKQAKINSKLYEDAFLFIPRNKDPNDRIRKRAASIWPVWDRNPDSSETSITSVARKTGNMPFEKEFWKKPQHTASASKLDDGVKGFITLLPIEWTKDENNRFKFPNQLLVKNDQNGKKQSSQVQIASTDIKSKQG